MLIFTLKNAEKRMKNTQVNARLREQLHTFWKNEKIRLQKIDVAITLEANKKNLF